MATFGNEDTSTGNMVYVSVNNGRLVTRVPEGTEGAESRVLTAGPNEGNTVWEMSYNTVSGILTGVDVIKKDLGGKKMMEIQVIIDGDTMVQLPMTLLKHFAMPLGNRSRVSSRPPS